MKSTVEKCGLRVTEFVFEWRNKFMIFILTEKDHKIVMGTSDMLLNLFIFSDTL